MWGSTCLRRFAKIGARASGLYNNGGPETTAPTAGRCGGASDANRLPPRGLIATARGTASPTGTMRFHGRLNEGPGGLGGYVRGYYKGQPVPWGDFAVSSGKQLIKPAAEERGGRFDIRGPARTACSWSVAIFGGQPL